MKISIITPTFNSEATLEKTIKSILSQENENFEHIIIDNESTDNTIKVINKLYSEKNKSTHLKIISEKDEGIADAFNKGIKNATGDVIAILNSDDSYLNVNLFTQVLNIFKDEKILFLHGDIFFTDEKHGSNIRRALNCPVTDALPFNHPTMFLRKEIYEKFGLFDISYKFAMDFELICRFEKNIPNFREAGFYYQEKPMVAMASGGASVKYELSSMKEVKRALMTHGYWNRRAKRKYLFRVIRIKLKKYFSYLGLNGIIKYWRNKKWAQKE